MKETVSLEVEARAGDIRLKNGASSGQQVFSLHWLKPKLEPWIIHAILLNHQMVE